MPDLPVLIGAAVVVVAALLAAVFVRRARRAPRPDELGLPAYRPRSEEDERRELGIGEVRPRDLSRPRPAPVPVPAEAPPPPDAPEAPPAPRPTPPAAAVVSSASSGSIRRARHDDELSPDEAMRAAQEHLLNALLLSSGAHSVVLLREETGTHLRYHIERIVSRNAFARPHGHFVSRSPLLPAEGKRRTALHRVGHGHPFPPDALGYYRETLTALREVLATPLTLGTAPYVLVADTMQDGRLGGRRVKTLIEATARMLEHTPLPDAAEAGSGDGLSALVDTPAQRSTVAVLADALATAGAAGLTLVLAHVEPEAETGTALSDADTAQAEAALRDHIALDLPDDTQLERFGDLTFAAFVPDTSEALDAWVEALFARLAAAYPEGRVAVGAVVYDGLAPLSADDLRGHALDALASSYEEATPVILG